MDHASNFAALLLLFSAVGTSPAMAQTPVEGAYERMDTGHQKIARALFEAQIPNTIPGGTSRIRRAASRVNPLTLDEISALKENGRAWGFVFQTMRARGLVVEDNLGQVMAKYEQRRVPTGVVAKVTRAHPKTQPDEGLPK
ncbi:MAG TPA: hypothetical protein VMR23_13765 [Candidatus Limnocylindria bacterium]|nr:hypothetical protein [Candidatus Limnocylindria bacterium]